MPEIDKETKELLDKMGFVPSKNEPKDYINKTDDIEAHVDFRKVDGRRWARIGTKFVAEKDLNEKVPILKTFKEERDKIENKLLSELGAKTLQSPKGDTSERDIPIVPNMVSNPTTPAPNVEREKPLFEKTIPSNSGVKIPLSPTPNEEQQGIPPNVPASHSPNLYEFFYELVGAGGIIEIFGDTGTLKSQLCVELCKDARKINKTFFYLDTEGKAGLHNKKELGSDYKYLPIWEEIIKTIKEGLSKKDLYIVDSIGFPISTEYADMKANEQGDSLQEMMVIVGKYLKNWAFKNDAIVIFTNQPKSSFMKSAEELLRLNPFGDKVHFAANMILKATKTIIPGHFDNVKNKVIPPQSVGTYTSHRSPDFMDDIEVLTMIKNDNEIKVIIPNHIIKRLKELKE